MTTELVIDIATETVSVVRPQIDLEVDVASPSIDLSVPGPRGPIGPTPMVFGYKGPVDTAPLTGTVPFFPRKNGRITRVTAAVGDQASGSTRVDVNLNGVSVFTNQAHRPNLTGTGVHFDDADLVDQPVFTDTDYLTVDIDTLGVGVEDLIVTVEYEPT